MAPHWAEMMPRPVRRRRDVSRVPLFVFALAAYEGGLLAGFADSGIASVGRRHWSRAGGRRVAARPASRSGCGRGGRGVVCGARHRAHAAKLDRAAMCMGANCRSSVAVLGGDASPGAFAPAQLVDCAGSPISLSVAERRRTAAGSTVSVTGAVVRSASGIVVQHAATVEMIRASAHGPYSRGIHGPSDRSDVRRRRAARARAARCRSRPSSPRTCASDSRAAGLVHILAISGLHIGIVAAITVARSRARRLPARGRPLAAFTIVSLYIMAIGAPAASVRAGMMLAVRASRAE